MDKNIMKEKAVNLIKKKVDIYEISRITGLSNDEIWEALKEIDYDYYSAFKIFERERNIFSGFDKLYSDEENFIKHI